MLCKTVTAIMRGSELERVETRLRELQVPGITVTKVRGYGEDADLLSHDWMSSHVRLEVVIEEDQVEMVVRAILKEAHTGLPGDGILFVSPLDLVYRIRSGVTITPHRR